MLLKTFLFFYNLAWLVAFPFLKRKPRIALGWSQRIVKDVQPGPYDIWIQAASGGESLLTTTILAQLTTYSLPHKLRILVTSGTRQGIDSLSKALAEREISATLKITVAYFPFDAPYLMQRAFALFSPKLAVIIETELWPGFLITAKQHDIPVLLINGRISEKSFRSYRRVKKFFISYGPEKILAISSADQNRFATLVGQERVKRINNIKFDKIELQNDSGVNDALPVILPPASPFIVLGSVRREEEDKILTAIQRLLKKCPDIVIGLFPKHNERTASWQKILAAINIPHITRSSTSDPVPPGTVLIWDIFGELVNAYSHAKATFVGGSLVDLGGQNFLEPLIYGLRPVIGPYWKDFDWVGREVINLGLVREVADEHQLADLLIQDIKSDESPEIVLQQVQQFIEPRRGGTKQACELIISTLHS
jgi:3-deoxy-D-manno-octulosonic-acid transferase